MKNKSSKHSDPRAEALFQGRLDDPFAYLGLHQESGSHVVRVYQPHATAVWLETAQGRTALQQTHTNGLFEWHGNEAPPHPYRLAKIENGNEQLLHDCYAFSRKISSFDLHLFNEGKLHQGYHVLGSHCTRQDGILGIRFAVWAPNARRVSVVGDFNRWDGRTHLMAAHGSSGVWEIFIPDLAQGTLYKFEILSVSGELLVKTDPYANAFELRPSTASRAGAGITHVWQDDQWLARRNQWDWLHQPLNIYEIHAGSWRRHPDGRFYSYLDLAEYLIPYLQEMHYTHVELMPVSEHPLDESWGYQTTGYFAASSRYGTPDELCFFIDSCHQAGIGVLLDWVPAHFPQDSFALARFDGTALYEHEDPRLGYHQDWGTHIFNYGRNEVKSFLLSSAHYWLSQFHFDGLRVDAVASMLYLDYSRKADEWLPNKYGGRENLEAIEFLRELNIMVHQVFPGALTLAEESTSWPGVSRPVYLGGLGFSMKWNMGWMNDTLSFMRNDPVHRRYELNQLTFSQLYAYTENFMLPFSHDEVVHGKGSLLDKMPGDTWQKFANLRLLLTYQMTSPGKKLNFMGNEFGQGREWRSSWELDWWQLGTAQHRDVQNTARDLNRLYRELPALYQLEFEQAGFSWLDCHDAERTLLSFLRRGSNGEVAVVALNFTPVPRNRYRIGLPYDCSYKEAFNSDSTYYGGSNTGNGYGIRAEAIPWMGQPFSAEIELPPLAGIILVPA
ncbi:MAG: 1,4-alpha-glucan branching enzyme [Gallionellales bacterium 35-53-114]|jgi:1,4-alpha-glucan branching enzyme|nr:MAG: 1,4-alpha-glucan branching enzyme [Gallionellales bacterium 35-53-114]OYZ65206.1 MAG: 1,4-alpha-glucan branching enzyme [Gallionellales bacterium 24-53-125]OZB08112.1 MAG: 1,4-alpha-glucan branching enzyme [Gallionellales bacterium 39-52-133]HQS58033.1 1,4-alpha-glucan branching protein GlgB [Gallionellaceae bacterium]HQS73589.1 1,4-alpha-glucan branching protein GlgB [Gallionellaceae bacterium]